MNDKAPTTSVLAIKQFARGGLASADDRVVVEEPLEIRVETGDDVSRSIAITMRTPGNDEALATGFLFSEGIIRAAGEIEHVTAAADDNRVTVRLAAGVEPDLDKLERHFYATSSCGVCGKASLEALETLGQYSLADSDFRIDAAALCSIPGAAAAWQDAFAATGGVHAAAVFTSDGVIEDLCEDVGRHNALDKLAGRALARDRLPWRDHGVFVSGRASFELLQKTMMAGAPLLAAVGAPSSLAVDLAWEFGITLIGFLRDGRFNVYSEAGRVEA